MFNIFGPRYTFPAYLLQTEDITDERIKCFQKILQRKASRFNIYLEITGTYDEQTRKAVTSYQLRSLSIVNPDGFVGPQTAKKLRIGLTENVSP